ncbi:MAG: DUF1643 domain-containing protein [Bacteroidales bacterium]|nr:DUF1643 domain-containing protein [Bacteroidales bacterium]
MLKTRDYFDITGFFYNIKEYSFRSYLNIKRKDSEKNQPDLMVIMMNPGSSRQNKGFENILEKEVPTIPDNTQDQIMRVMDNANLDYARILNLSDLRETKSKILYEKIEILKDTEIVHSVFDNRRNYDFEKLFIKGKPVICAWGVNENLSELANLAIEKIKGEKIIGIKKESVENAYYHPLPQNYNKQKEWVEEISKQLIMIE